MRKSRSRYLFGFILFVLFGWYWFSLPRHLFADPYSTVLEDKSGHLLGARIALDGQWRFPGIREVPEKFQHSILLYEDQFFHQHPGVNPLSVARAFWQNIRAGKVVSGGSTITMQVIRMFRRQKKRSLTVKLAECFLATRLELSYSKEEILSLYTAHAPFGGNVVGLEAACWRYFGRSADALSWAEAAMLAVLPNNPSLIHPGKNREILMEKRNRLLVRLLEEKVMDTLTWQLAVAEPLPGKPLALPDLAPHLLGRAVKSGYSQQRVTSTVDLFLQQEVARLVQQHHQRQRENEIWNAAAIVMEVASGNVLAYVGNVQEEGARHQNEVDIIDAPRSSGSILKPFLYAAMLDEGFILPGTLLSDIPLVINGFAPKNFSKQYDGAVPANRALVRSLNVPAVQMLKDFRYERFHLLLRKMGMKSLVFEPDHYGLSLILGGAEARLWEVAGMYASLGRVVKHYQETRGEYKYFNADYHLPVWTKAATDADPEKKSESEAGLLSAAAIWQTLETITEVNRPEEESGWKNFSSAQRIAWKTGTSYGLRDAWAIGLTPDYVVAVWAGNATGEGRPGLTGGEVAAPLMFDIFDYLPNSSAWFKCPLDEMTEAEICTQSGYLAGLYCDDRQSAWITKAGNRSSVCKYHKLLHLSADEQYQVNAQCENTDQIKSKNWFVLPPAQAHYYQAKNMQYRPVPPYREDCSQGNMEPVMEIIYPRKGSQIFIPRQLDGTTGKVTFQLAHSARDRIVFWHLDALYLGQTTKQHHLSMQLPEGKHTLILVDELGLTLNHHFEVISKE